MAKGDHSRAESAINTSVDNSQRSLQDTRDRINQQGADMWSNYQKGTEKNLADYDSVMGNYNKFFQGGNQYNAGNALSGYQNFADTGGFSPQDVQNIRARMIAPIRGVYSNAQRNVERAGRMGATNTAAAAAKMAREQGYATSDATTNAEAAIAEMLQKGKLAGLGGLESTSLGLRGQDLGALGGMTSLYGASPGLSREFGQMVTQNRSQDLEGQKIQQLIDEMRVKGTLDLSKVPGDTQAILGNISSMLGLGGQAATIFSGLPFFGGGGAPYGGGNIGKDWGVGSEPGMVSTRG